MLSERPLSFHTLMDAWSCSLLPVETPRTPLLAELALAFDPVSHVEGEAHGGRGLQRGHAGLQGPVSWGLHTLVPLSQHLSDAHHGEPASAFHTVWAPQGLSGAVTWPWGWGTHALLFGGAVLIIVGKGDQSWVQRGLESGWASGQQDGRERPLTGTPASQAPGGAQDPVVMGWGQHFRLLVAVHGLEGAHHVQHQGVFLGGDAGAPRPWLRGLRFLDNLGGPGGWHRDELHGGRSHTIGVRGFAENITAAEGIFVGEAGLGGLPVLQQGPGVLSLREERG